MLFHKSFIKPCLILLTILSISIHSFGSKNVESDSANKFPLNIAFSGGPQLSIISVGDVNGLCIGGQGEQFLSSHFAIGGFGGGIVSHSEVLHTRSDQSTTSLEVKGGFGGVLGSYTLNPDANITFTIPCKLGMGGISIKDQLENIDESSSYIHAAIGFEASVPFGKHFSPTVGVSYLHAHLLNSVESISDNALSGMSLSLRFEFQ